MRTFGSPCIPARRAEKLALRGEDLALCAKWNGGSFSPALSVGRVDWREGGDYQKVVFCSLYTYPVCGKPCAECEIISFPLPRLIEEVDELEDTVRRLEIKTDEAEDRLRDLQHTR